MTTTTDRLAGLVPLDDAYRLLRVSRRTLYHWRDRGRLDVVNIGRSAWVPVEQVRALVSWGDLGVEEAAAVAAELRRYAGEADTPT